MSKLLVIVGRTHFNKGIKDQLLLGLAIGGGCHVVGGACDHYFLIGKLASILR